MDRCQLAVSCVTDAVFSVRGGYFPSSDPHALSFAAEPWARLQGGVASALAIECWYRIVPVTPGDRRRWRIESAAYMYTLFDSEMTEILGYHWHPISRSVVATSHLHLQAGARIGLRGLKGVHLPTGHVTLAQFIRCLIEELGVEPRRTDWNAVLERAEAAG
jgi:hypothetical protein